jgi:hypothetical protein
MLSGVARMAAVPLVPGGMRSGMLRVPVLHASVPPMTVSYVTMPPVAVVQGSVPPVTVPRMAMAAVREAEQHHGEQPDRAHHQHHVVDEHLAPPSLCSV